MVRIRAENHGKVFQQQLVNHFFHDIEDRMRYNHKVKPRTLYFFNIHYAKDAKKAGVMCTDMGTIDIISILDLIGAYYHHIHA